MQSSTGNAVSGAEYVLKNALPASSLWRWRKNDKKGNGQKEHNKKEHDDKEHDDKEMVRLSLGRLARLPDPWIFQYPVCMAGTSLLLYTASHSGRKRQQGLLQQVLRQGTALFPGRRQVRAVPSKGHTRMDEVKVLPLWISDLFLRNVFPHAVEHLAGIRRRQGSRHGRDTAVDVQAPVALGLSRHPVFRRRHAVCLWLLQCDAHIHRAGIPYHGLIQAPLLVRVLSYGYDDTADLPGKKVPVPLAGQFPEALSVQNRNASP